MYSYEADQLRLQNLMNETDSDNGSNFDDDEDTDEEDFVEEMQEGSESEQDVYSDMEESNSEDEDVPLSKYNHYVGKNRSTKWMKQMPPKNVRTRQENYVTRLPISRLPTKDLKETLDIWSYFFDEQMITIIVENTNKYILVIKEKFTRNRDARLTDIVEMRAFIGLLYHAGTLKANHLNADDLWATDGNGVEIFRLTMSLMRFRFLLRCCRFDDKETREERKKLDKLAPIRQFFDIFVAKCKEGFSLSAYVTIDEKLEGFRGKCNFRQYIPSKPNKYGIKIFALSDAKMYYTSNLEVYVGLQPEGPYRVSNSPQDIVKRLCEIIYGTGRNLTIDNWFTSFELVNHLYDKKITVIGTMRKNKAEIPLEFLDPNRQVHSSLFGFQKNCTIVSYVPKKKKNVILLSSLHHDNTIDEDSGDLRKPEIITAYNSTKGGVDVVDQLCANYNCARSTRRWPMVIFYALLNVGGINSMVLYAVNNPNINMKRKNFLKRLSQDLVKPYWHYRVGLKAIPINTKSRIREICGTQEPANEQPQGTKGRCFFCGTKKNRCTRFSCIRCKRYMCLEHLQGICQICVDNI